MTEEDKDKLADIAWFIKGQIDLKEKGQAYSIPFDESHALALTRAINNSPRMILIDKSIAEKYWIQAFVKDFDNLMRIVRDRGSVFLADDFTVRSAAFVSNYQYRRLNDLFSRNKLIELKKK